MVKNIRNKILTREEINAEAEKRMNELLSKYPKREHSTILRFLNESQQINFWVSDKITKLENKKLKIKTSNIKKESLEVKDGVD